MRTAVIAIALALTVLLAGIVAGTLYLGSQSFRRQVEILAGGTLGRTVGIGAVAVEPGWTTVFRFSDITVANAEWAGDEPLAAVDRLEVSLRLLPLLAARVELPLVQASGPRLSLRRDRQGRVNWQFGPAVAVAGEVAAPDERQEFPAIGRLVVSDGRVRFDDASRGIALDGDLETVWGEAAHSRRIRFTLTGTLEEQPMTVAFTGGSLDLLHDDAIPYPLELALRWGESGLAVQGTVLQPLRMAGFDLALTMEGRSLSKTFPVLGIPLPPTPAYRFEGRVQREANAWRIRDFHGRVGRSDMAGDLELAEAGERSRLTGRLRSDNLYLADLAGLIGAGPAAADSDKADGILPTAALADERLQAMDMDIRFDARRIVTDDLAIDDLSTRLRLSDGAVSLDPLSLKIAGGSAAGTLRLDAQPMVPQVAMMLELADLDLKPFFAGTAFVQEMGGRFHGRLDLSGQGRSVKQILGSADGNGWLGIRDGAVSGLLVEAAGLDLSEALVLVIGEDARIPLHCGRLDAIVSGGIAKIGQGIVDTTDSILLADGAVSLGEESLDLRIEARAKDFSLIDLSAPVLVRGSLADPEIAVGKMDALPFFETGEDVDIDCDALLSGKGVRTLSRRSSGHEEKPATAPVAQ